METYEYHFTLKNTVPEKKSVRCGVAGSGNLEIVLAPQAEAGCSTFTVHTNISGYKPTWDAVIARFVSEYPYAGLTYTLYDAGASPAVVALRLRQVIETYQHGYRQKDNYLESNARSRIETLVDAGVSRS